MNKRAGILVPFIITAIVIAISAYTIYSVFAPNNNVVPAFDEGKLYVVVRGDLVETDVQPLFKDGEILMPLALIKDHIDENILWDEKAKKVTITTRDRVIRMKTDSLDAVVNNKPVLLNIPASIVNGKVFIPIEFLSDFYNIKINYIKNNNVIVIDFTYEEKKLAHPLKPGVPVRKGSSIHFPVLEKVGTETQSNSSGTAANALIIFGEKENWYKVRTANGVVGYVEKKLVSVETMPPEKPEDSKQAPASWKPQKGKINMVWDYTWNGRPDLQKREKIEGLDVISPTSFQVVAENGEIINRADAAYVEWAHNNGYKVWALFSNNFEKAGQAGKFLRDTDAREYAIKQLLSYAALYKLDGINFDFEGLPDSDRDALTQFIREASVLFKEQGLVVSVDINTQGCYDRKALAECADYVMVMSYDQHWSGSKVSGSVSEIPWSENTIKMYLNTIPAEKLILGIPFYTRIWREKTGNDGSISVTSKAVSMESAKKAVADNKAVVTLDEESRQNYAEYFENGDRVRIWLEDASSIDLRTSLVLKYNIAGAAAWRKDFETDDIWPVISMNLKSTASYNEWQARKQATQVQAPGQTHR